MSLKGKNILLGITGSIAAYKSALIVRLLVKAGAHVKVIMTPAATSFITPLTIATLSKNEVLEHLSSDSKWTNHVELGLWADVFLIAPASANTVAKMATGICDNLLLATYLSARCPVIIAPAMDLDMWLHPATQDNIKLLVSRQVQLIPVEKGELASGLNGAGRMAEPENIIPHVEALLAKQKTFNTLSGKTVLINAGATKEPIDPVRFISNHSSGKMGIALADYCAQQGAQVTLVLGASNLLPTHSAVNLVRAETAAKMYEVMTDLFPKNDITICAAAIADYTPAQPNDLKIKKKEATMSIALEKTKDILAELGSRKQKNQYLIGFALETNNELENAKEKLLKKNADLMVLNSMQDAGAGFNTDTNKITLIDRQNKTTVFELKNKSEVAQDIINYILPLLP
jgi:phosphopantothenoylcysteine decarboxylase / phosphopantothenate---cysteine ligase